MSSLIFVPINKFFGSVNDYKDIMNGNYQILVVSKDIISDVAKESSTSMTKTYGSRYKNIDFVDSLFPSPAVLEFKYGSSEDAFVDAYTSQLKRKGSMEDLSCIIDLMVNSDINIIVLMSNAEYMMDFIQTLQHFIWDMFKVKTYLYEDFVVEPETVTDIGNVEESKKLLQFHINDLDLKDQITGEFLNKMYVDMRDVYIKTLSNKSVDDLVRMGASMGVYVSRHKPKDYIIDHLMKSLLSDDVKFV